jgi:plasmid rolling circle replication initiator protein Rep
MIQTTEEIKQIHSKQSYLSEDSPEDSHWDILKQKSSIIADAYFAGNIVQQRRGKRSLFCSQMLFFGVHVNMDTGELKHRLRSAQFCRVRLEPICMQRKSLRWKARFHEAWPKIRDAYPTARYMHLVLTVKNCDIKELRVTIKVMNSGWHRMYNRNTFPATGFIKSIEVTREMDYCEKCKSDTKKRTKCPNKKNHTYNQNAHAHIHALLQVPSSYFGSKYYITQDEWAQMWQQSLKVDYKPVVYVAAVKPKQKDGRLEDAVAAAVKEVAKYCVKFDDVIEYLDKPGGLEWFLELDNQLEKTRAIAVGGAFKEFMSEEDPTEDEMLKPEDEDEEVGKAIEYREYLYKHLEKKYALKRIIEAEEEEDETTDYSHLRAQ